jgi:hypothetical protein
VKVFGRAGGVSMTCLAALASYANASEQIYQIGTGDAVMYTNIVRYASLERSPTVTYSSVQPISRKYGNDAVLPRAVANRVVTNAVVPPVSKVQIPEWGEAIKIAPKIQATRDVERRRILEDELTHAESALVQARQQQDQVKTQRLEADLVALRREISLLR